MDDTDKQRIRALEILMKHTIASLEPHGIAYLAEALKKDGEFNEIAKNLKDKLDWEL